RGWASCWPRRSGAPRSRCTIAPSRSPTAGDSPSRGPMVSWRSILSLFLLGAAAAPAEEVTRIVLRVNDRIATLQEYESRRDDRLQMIAAAQGIDEAERRRLVEEVGKATMKEIFDELLILSRAQQLRVIVTRDQVNRALAATRERYGLASDAEFE